MHQVQSVEENATLASQLKRHRPVTSAIFWFGFLTLICGFGVAPASAEMLLATFTVPGHVFDAVVQRPAHMSFGVATREPFPGEHFSFLNEYTPDQVGTVYEAPSMLVAQMAPLFLPNR
jgi:hypothetical protein